MKLVAKLSAFIHISGVGLVLYVTKNIFTKCHGSGFYAQRVIMTVFAHLIILIFD